MAGLIDPQGNPVSSTPSPSPQIRPRAGTTSSQTTQNIQQYGSPARHTQGSQELNTSVDELSKMSTEIGRLNTNLEEVLKNISSGMKDSNKEISRMMRSLKDVVSESNDIEESFRQMVKIQKEVVKTGMFDGRKRDDIVKSLSKMKDKWEDIVNLSTDNKFQSVYRKGLEDITKQLQKVEAANEDAFSTEYIEELEDSIESTNRSLEKMKKNIESIQSNSQHLANTFKTIQQSGTWLGNSKMISNITKYYDKKSQAEKSFASLKDQRESRLKANQEYIQSAGGGQAVLQNYKGKGLSSIIDNKIASIASKNPEGALGKIALSGGGSFMKGLGAKMVGGAELGGMGVTGIAGKLAGPVAVAQALASIYDMNIERNKKVNELAGGGIYGGAGTDVGKTMLDLRKTMASSTFFEQAMMGQSTDKNIDIMKSLIEGGRGISDVGGKDLGDITARGQGFYGSIMKNAVYGASPLGLSQDQAVKLQLKAVDEYQATLDQVNEFFVDVSKNTKAAGISTGKYLDILDSVNGNFDNMNKSLATSVNLINTLGRSGRLTGERMKEILTTLTGNQVQRPEMRMFAMTQMSEADKRGLTAGLGRETEGMKTRLEASMLKETGLDVRGKSIGDIEDMLKGQFQSGKIDQKTYQTLTGNIADYRNKVRANETYTKALQSGDYATAAGVAEMQGTGSLMNMGHLFGSMKGMARGAGTDIGTLLSSDVKTNAKASQSYLAYTMAQGITGAEAQKNINAARQYVRAGAEETMTQGNKGQLSQEYISSIMKDLAARGYVNLTGKETGGQLQDMFIKLQRGETKLKGGKNLTDALTELPSVLNAMQSGVLDLTDVNKRAEELERDKKAEDIAKNTKTTGDIMAQSFEYLFAKVTNILGDILNVLKNPFGGPSDEDLRKWTANAGSAASAFGGVDTTKWDRGDANRFSDLQSKAKAGRLTDEEYREMINLAKKNGVDEKTVASAVGYVNQNATPIQAEGQTIAPLTATTAAQDTQDAAAFFAGQLKTFGGIDLAAQNNQFTLTKGSRKYEDMIASARAQGVNIQQQDAGGGRVTYTVVNYNSADFSGSQPPQQGAGDSGQTAPLTTTPGRK